MGMVKIVTYVIYSFLNFSSKFSQLMVIKNKDCVHNLSLNYQDYVHNLSLNYQDYVHNLSLNYQDYVHVHNLSPRS